MRTADLLLAAGANPDLDPVDTFFSLCSRGMSDMALALLSTQPELFDRASDPEEHLLIDAIAKNKAEAVSAMLEVGFSVEAQPDGDQPLHIAAKYGREKFLYMLLDAQAPLRAHNFDDRTPLALAVCFSESPPTGGGDYLETVRCLLEAGARPEAWMLNIASPEIAELLGRNV